MCVNRRDFLHYNPWYGKLQKSNTTSAHQSTSPPTSSFHTMDQKSEPYFLDLSFRGWVQGLTLLSPHSTPKCHFFGGIPYAQPPIRFQKSKSLAPCYRYGTKKDPAKFTQGCGVCPQGGSGEQGDETSADSNWDEDCLQLNIWIPVEKAPEKGMQVN